jgi:hypothetical protein
MNIRRILLDVDKAMERPSIIELAESIDAVEGVDAINITVTEIDLETVGMEITIEGVHLDYDAIEGAILRAGAVVHSIDELVVGSKLLSHVDRRR